jgi:hypothetical protein
MKALYKILILVTSTFLISSCENFFEMTVELDVPEHVSKLAVTAIMNTERENTLKNSIVVSCSQGVKNDVTNDQLVANADIVLSDGNTDYTFSMSEIKGVYIPDNELDFVPDKTYTLTVAAPKYDVVSASQKLPKAININQVSMDSKKVRIKFTDPAGKKNYYSIKLYRYNEEEDTYYDIGIDPFGESTEWSYLTYGIIFNDTNFDGEETEIIANYYDYSESGETSETKHYKVVLHHLSEDFYKYDRSYNLSQESNGNPFAEPVILHRNIDKGYGVFTLNNKTQYEFDYTN